MDIGLSALGFFRNQRMIAEFTPLVVEESIDDSLELTEHPIEDGSVITDHVIYKPITCTMDVYFDESLLGGDSVRTIYDKIRALQASAQPFTVVCGKRVLDDMLLKSVHHVTDKDSEYVLHLSLEFQQIKRVTLEEVSIKTPEGQQSGTQQSGKKSPQGETNAANSDGAANSASKNSSALYDLVF